MNPLRITAIQTDLVWELPEANRSNIDALLSSIDGETDIVVLPEMFSTGFTMNVPAAAELFSDDMNTLRWMQAWALKLKAVMTGSVSVSENNHCYNRLFWVRPDGTYSSYDKRHLFTLAKEDQHYTAGTSTIVEEWKGWNICPLICYDLRFPVWSRNKLVDGKPLYDVLIYVANWPEVRREPWKKLLLARAIENQAYVVGVNRVGIDANHHAYKGDSSFINPRGEYLLEIETGIQTMATCSLDMQYLDDFRRIFPVLNDADAFEIK